MSEVVVDYALNIARATLVLFLVVDPFGSIPLFMGLTEKMTKIERRKVFNTATLVSVILLLAFAFAGQQILSIFGVSLFSFEIAGGILLLIIAVKILISGSLEDMSSSPESMGAVPIAMPLLVGPGAITTTILNLQSYGIAIAAISVLIVLLLTWFILKYVDLVYRFLGKTGAVVIARVMALLIGAIAIQYLLLGVTHFLETIS